MNISRASAEPRCRGRVLPFEMHPSSSPFEPRPSWSKRTDPS